MAGTGHLVLVVGPSGAGKDALIAGASAALANDALYVFPRRVVTRHAMIALEDHDSLDRSAFLIERLAGAYALDWEAHGLCYGLPVAIERDLAVGRIVVANVSRKVIAVAQLRYPGTVVVLVTAAPAIRAARLAGRGRETAEEIAARLARDAPLPSEIDPVVIDNSGTLADGINTLVAVLQAVATSPV